MNFSALKRGSRGNSFHPPEASRAFQFCTACTSLAIFPSGEDSGSLSASLVEDGLPALEPCETRPKPATLCDNLARLHSAAARSRVGPAQAQEQERARERERRTGRERRGDPGCKTSSPQPQRSVVRRLRREGCHLHCEHNKCHHARKFGPQTRHLPVSRHPMICLSKCSRHFDLWNPKTFLSNPSLV